MSVAFSASHDAGIAPDATAGVDIKLALTQGQTSSVLRHMLSIIEPSPRLRYDDGHSRRFSAWQSCLQARVLIRISKFARSLNSAERCLEGGRSMERHASAPRRLGCTRHPDSERERLRRVCHITGVQLWAQLTCSSCFDHTTDGAGQRLGRDKHFGKLVNLFRHKHGPNPRFDNFIIIRRSKCQFLHFKARQTVFLDHHCRGGRFRAVAGRRQPAQSICYY